MYSQNVNQILRNWRNSLGETAAFQLIEALQGMIPFRVSKDYCPELVPYHLVSPTTLWEAEAQLGVWQKTFNE